MLFDLKRAGASLLILFALNFTVYANRIVVKNQHDFEQLAEAVSEQLNRGRNVEVQIREGIYYYSDKHLLLKDIIKPKLSVKINCREAIFVPKASETEITPYHAVIRNLKDANLWSGMFITSEKVAVIDATKKLCRIKRGENLDVKEGGYILLTRWYTSGLYKIEKVERDYIYFTASNTRYREKYGEYDVNFDYVYNESYPRYKLLITDNLPDDCYVCSSSSFLSIQNCQFSKFEINGLKFVGGSGQDAVVKLGGLKASTVKLTNCIFLDLHNNAIALKSTDNVTIDRCEFANCYSTTVTADENCSHLIVKKCLWRECGQLLENPSCVIASGVYYVIKGNTFVDFCGRALTLGVYYSKGNDVHSSGVIENNDFYFTPSFLETAHQNLLMDNGAIYVNTLNDHLEIRNNYIHDFSGACDNRGIFLDDGAMNVKITGNVITNVPNGAAISARRVKSVESTVGAVNMGNSIQGNVYEGIIRFVGNEVDSNGCEYGDNYHLVQLGNDCPKTIVKNVHLIGEDVVLICTGNEKAKICIDGKSYKQIKKSPVWKKVKKKFSRKNK